MKLIFSFKKQLTFCIALSIFGLLSAQTKQIQGTVLDEYEVPLMGASVIIQGTVQGTITDFNGLFSIESNKVVVIEVSYVGYITQEISAKPGDDIVMCFSLLKSLKRKRLKREKKIKTPPGLWD